MEQSRSIKEKREGLMLLNYGGARAFIAQMNARDLEEARQSILRRVKEKAFSKGLPIYYTKDGRLVAEYGDGRIEVVKS